MPFFSGRCYSEARLDGKTAIVTGSNTGIGKETAHDFYKRGAKVIMTCRSLERAEAAKTDIENQCKSLSNTGKIILAKCDLGSLKSVREFAQNILDTEPQIDILVNNAGVWRPPQKETEDGFEVQFGTNHLGHFLLTLLLLPRIKNSTPARIVNVSSLAHQASKIHFDDIHYKTRAYNMEEAYGQSKCANVLFTVELTKRLKEHNIEGVNTYTLHPGAVMSELGRHLSETLFRGATRLAYMLLWPFMKSPELGAQTTIYCSVDEKCANETGLYYSDCVPTAPAPHAVDEEDANRLWEVSLDMVGLKGYNPFTASDPGVKQA